MSQVAHGAGSAKLILFGEHAVVHGEPAIVAGLDRGARAHAREGNGILMLNSPTGELLTHATLHPDSEDDRLGVAWSGIVDALGHGRRADVEVTLEVPPGAGLGSSAALAVAAARALVALRGGSEEDVTRAVHAAEQTFHGRASGIDQAAAQRGGLFTFTRTESGALEEPIEAPAIRALVCQAAPGASTRMMVEAVSVRRERTRAARELVSWIGALVRDAADALALGDLDVLGELMDLNHGALSALGASSPELDAACHAARAAGARGAKLTGAGGGGCVWALPGDDPAPVLDAWRAMGLEGFEVVLGG